MRLEEAASGGELGFVEDRERAVLDLPEPLLSWLGSSFSFDEFSSKKKKKKKPLRFGSALLVSSRISWAFPCLVTALSDSAG